MGVSGRSLSGSACAYFRAVGCCCGSAHMLSLLVVVNSVVPISRSSVWGAWCHVACLYFVFFELILKPPVDAHGVEGRVTASVSSGCGHSDAGRLYLQFLNSAACGD